MSLIDLPFAAAFFSLLFAVASLLRKKPSPAAWCFFAGMTALGLDSLCTGLGLRAARPDDVVAWLMRAFVVESFIPVMWLGFSLTYSRGNYREFLARWKLPLLIGALLPLVSLGFKEQLIQLVPTGTDGELGRLQIGPIAKLLNIVFLTAAVLVLVNLEQTFRSAVGTMRWRIKFVVLAMGLIFGVRIYVRSQAILFSTPDVALAGVESGALLLGCFFLAVAYVRTGLAEIDVYPSLDVLRSSLTLLIVGGYLLVIGVLAQIVRRFGGAEAFQIQALVVLVGMAGLATLLMSDRLRHGIHRVVVRHFSKAQHDSVRIWALFSRRLANVKDQDVVCTVAARSISETFDVLSVTVWLLDEHNEQFFVGASTSRHTPGTVGNDPAATASAAVVAGLRSQASPFDLEGAHEAWAAELRQLNPTGFANGGARLCVPLRAGDKSFGVVVLADRVNAAVYTLEELELLACIGDQVTSVLLNLRLANEVVQAKELEAFRTMSAFFVHDLKNAAASLNLMLKNLPVHFDDPEFRQDALRGVGNTARRIDDMIARLSALKQRPDFSPAAADLNALVGDTLDRLGELTGVALTTEYGQLPTMLADREQLQNVITNLVLNARDAASPNGRIQVRTDYRGDRVVLSIEDNGSGMSAAFVKDSLFRPFQSTKKQGLGIGMFQSRLIVERHGGTIQVESEPGHGTTVRVHFPVANETR